MFSFTGFTEQKHPSHQHYIRYNTLSSRDAWLHCVSAPSAPLTQEKIDGRGLGATGQAKQEQKEEHEQE